jgi:polysaccharide biosynthesis PFTS motif protein
MKIPVITRLLQRRGRRRFRRMMRGHRFLKVSNQLGRITSVTDALASTRLDQCERRSSKLIFGAGLKDAELIIRQYLLIRMGGQNLIKALLFALGKPGSDVVHPLPPIWRKVLRQHGFEIDEVRSALAWNGHLVLFIVYSFVAVAVRIFDSIREIIRPQHKSLGRYAYFDTLIAGTLPRPCKDGRSHDIVTWYQQWPGRVSDLDTLCHSVKGVAPSTVDGVPVVSVPSAVLPLTKINALVRFVGWSVAASVLAIFDLWRGRWWHALILREASLAAIIRGHEPDNLARDYLFHNSGWLYRPLWTYEAEKRGSRVTFYFYSTQNEPFKQPEPEGYPKHMYGWQAVNWPYYLVWDEYQADFVRRAVGESVGISVVGPIWFNTGGEEVPELPPKTVAVFDVQPWRDAFYQTLGVDFDYSTPKTANQFLLDIYQTLKKCGGTMALKRKRKLGPLTHPKYRRFIAELARLPNFIAVDPDTSASRLSEDCVAVISRPFTSTALIARELGKPSIYYDPYGVLQKDDRAAHGIEIISGPEDLRAWLSAVLNVPYSQSKNGCLL